MNWIDLLFILLLAAGIWQGLRHGLIIAAGEVAGVVIGLWLAGSYYITFSIFLGEHLALRELFTRILIPLGAGIPTHLSDVLKLPAVMGGAMPSGTLSTGFPPSLWMPLLGVRAGITGNSRELLVADALVKLLAFFLIYGGVRALVDFGATILSKVIPLFWLGGLNRLVGACLSFLARVLDLVVTVGMLTPVLIGLAYTIPLGQGLLGAWNTSLFIPYFTKGWVLLNPLLKQVFQMI